MVDEFGETWEALPAGIVIDADGHMIDILDDDGEPVRSREALGRILVMYIESLRVAIA